MGLPEIATLVVLFAVWAVGVGYGEEGWASLFFVVGLLIAMAVFGWWDDLYPGGTNYRSPSS